MSAVWIIAKNTFRENLRDRILYNLLFFAALLIGASVVLGDLTFTEQKKIVTDVGLAAINVVGVIIAIFVGVGLVSKEIEKRTIYTLMARPINRVQFILGKYVGLGLTLAINAGVMLAVFLATLLMSGTPIHGGLFQATQLMFVELLLVMAMALLFSTFSTATLSATFTVALYLVGHVSTELKGLAANSQHEVLRVVANAVYYLCPNLEMLNVKGPAAAGAPISLLYQTGATVYGLLYAGLLLVLACVVFQRRDF